ncbi:glyoxalase/bleomycin resistance protein/dioxygenase superfamily protein [Anseongella ginsenosidimutans]|uniref:Glyoxalase/bleomycin resistance protein/dioxygenase superfamily protein n=1 Tax=Anseongella ginsenosidimutans TaxID=496056 RepID=A0A4R3KMI3_9SPHI|nr:VOC family protein [Anseongella ginsenosidimutans]QEC51929.1 glyoxalase [Anseongella ginsenosidimutans]TCS85040.1 glyoxalase/bleomycin resistance protein/dioxygenase superfamily protein [Anseongella ginsenosidimutans]
MIKIDPIIAVKDVNASAEWYQTIFGCHRAHGGDEFAVLKSGNNEVLLCLHKWGEHEHPTMLNRNITPGNGLILYFKVDNLQKVRQNAEALGHPVEADIHQNPNSMKMQFSLRDPDGYYLIITEYHDYA